MKIKTKAQINIKIKTKRNFKLRGRRAILTTIALYQRYLSPLKGFHCAHRRLHGGLSCSEYIKQTIAAQGLRRSLPLCRDRFQACRVAYETLKVRVERQRSQYLNRSSLRGQIFPQQSLEEAIEHEHEQGEKQDTPAETVTQGEYHAERDLSPPLPPPNPFASCLLCGAIEVCCGGPSSLGGMGCGDPLEGCSCCWDGCDLSACSCGF